MSKRLGLCISYLAISMIIFYLAYDARLSGDTLDDFLMGYLNTPQKYLFLMTVLITPILLCTVTPCFEASIRVRLKDKMFYYLLRRGVLIGFYSSISIFCTFCGVGIFWNLEISIKISYLFYLIKLFLFVFCMYTISNVFYFVSRKQILSVLLTIVVNFFLIMTIYSFSFYVMNNTMNEAVVNIIYEIYISICIIGGMMYLFLNAEREVCISQEK